MPTFKVRAIFHFSAALIAKHSFIKFLTNKMHKYCKHTVYSNFQVTSFSQNLIPKNQKMNSLSTIEILGLCIDYVNRHLYFTNMGWYSSTSPYHQVEMVDLRDAGKRKVLTSSLLEKPRDILIDLHYG